MESAKRRNGECHCSKQEGKKTFTISEKIQRGRKEKKTILNGTVTEDTFELSLLNPEEENTEVAHLSLKNLKGNGVVHSEMSKNQILFSLLMNFLLLGIHSSRL